MTFMTVPQLKCSQCTVMTLLPTQGTRTEGLRTPFLEAAVSQESTDISIMTWNIDAASRGNSDCSFVLPEVLRHDVACLQEVTPGAVEWFHNHLPKTYSVLTPVMRGHSWPQDGS